MRSHLLRPSMLKAPDGEDSFSVIASWLAEFLISRGQMRCIDGDLVNRSVSQYKTLGAENLDLVKEDGLIQRWLYDLQVEHFLTSENAFVVDSGATAFLPFWAYIVESALIRVPREAGRMVCTRAIFHRLQS